MTTTYREALREAHREALARDPRVFLMGEDVGRYGGSFAVSLGLLEEFGEERVRDTPLSESAFTGAGVGAALRGLRPIVEIMTVNFSLLALDQIMNNAATLRHMSGGQLVRAARHPHDDGRRPAARRAALAQPRGVVRVDPRHPRARPRHRRGRARHARGRRSQDPDPVVIFEHGSLYNLSGTLPAEPVPVDIEHAAIRRAGTDVTLIAYAGGLGKACGGGSACG